MGAPHERSHGLRASAREEHDRSDPQGAFRFFCPSVGGGRSREQGALLDGHPRRPGENAGPAPTNARERFL